MQRLALWFGCLLLVAVLGCSRSSESEPSGEGLYIVCTTGMIGDLVANVTGENAIVVALMGPGVDPHYYKATQGDLGKLSRADVIFFNGLFLEGKMEDILGKMTGSKTVVALSSALPEARLRRPDGGGGHFDPHIWFDVALWSETIDLVVKTLSVVDPAHAGAYEKNGETYRANLIELHRWVKAEVAQIPQEQRALVTAHDAFGYFGVAYGIDVRGLQGISTVAEYGVNDVSQLVAFISESQIKAIFVESSVPERSINAVRAGCEARGWTVAIGGTLYSDAMGPKGSGADTYVGMVRHNVNTIVEALK